MKFEDLFKQKNPSNYVERPKEPSNYVEQSKAMNPLEAFFAERVPKTKEEKAVEPITEEKKEEIKKTFTLPKQQPVGVEVASPVAQAPAEQPAQRMQIPDLSPVAEENKKEKSLSDRAEEMMPERDWTDMLPYLAPLLVGSLAGGSFGEAPGIAGKQLLEDEASRLKRKQTLEDKLLEMDKAKLTKDKDKLLNKRFQRTPVWDPELKRSVYANYDTVTGEMFYLDGTPIKDKGIEVGFAVTPEEASRRAAMAYEYKKRGIDYTPRLNPEKGTYERAGGQPIFQQEFEFSPVQRKALEDQKKSITSSKSFQEARTTLSGAEKVRGLLAQGSPAAVNSARLTILKMAGNVGATSDKDLELIKGDPSIVASAQRYYGRLAKGETMLAEDIVALKDIADLYYKKAKKDVSKSLEESDKIFSKKYKVPGGTLMSEVLPQAVELMPSKDMLRVQAPNGKTGWMSKEKFEQNKKKGYKLINTQGNK